MPCKLACASAKSTLKTITSSTSYVPSLHGHLLIACSFLTNAARVASLRYIPTTDDILRARLQTIGVEEHRLALETGAFFRPLSRRTPANLNLDSRLGERVDILRRRRLPRSARYVSSVARPASLSDDVVAAWAPFFDDGEFALVVFSHKSDEAPLVNAMIFLCPMSNFDVPLKEDPSVNSLVRTSPCLPRLHPDRAT